MTEDDGQTVRDGGRRESGSEAAAPDTVREPSVGIPGIGETIADKYRVDRVIGAGGMGQVLAVRHLKLDQLFAMKVLDPELVDDEDARARFGREARAMAALTSPHSVRVHDVAELPNKLPYLVMDYLEGEDLGRTLRQRGALPIEEAISYIDQACEALEEAHAAGLVHRDLKPQNLFLAKDPKGVLSVRVLDFGIARAVGGKIGKLETITRHGDIIGTLEYMAPEQIRSAKSVDPRTDIWALGACLYRMLTNARPFTAGSQAELIAAILRQEPNPLRELRPEVPPALALVVQSCMKKAPEDRFRSVAELRSALRIALATVDIPLDDATMPMKNAPVRPPPEKSVRPPGTLPMPKVTTTPPPASSPRAPPAVQSTPSQPAPPMSGPSYPAPPISGPDLRTSGAPRAAPSWSPTPLIIAVVVAAVLGIGLALLGLRLMQR